MMRTSSVLALGLTALAVVGCDREQAGDTRPTDATVGGEAVKTYDPDTLQWVQQGRMVEFNGRQWLPSGAPVHQPSVVPVGQFEGMQLYAPADATMPYDQLLFPIGDQEWQVLVPATAS